MKGALLWLKDHTWLLLVLVGCIAAWLLLRPAKKDQASAALKLLARERKAIDVKAAARRRTLEVGAANAVREIKERHEQQLSALSAAQKEKAHELEDDPAALSAFILRNAK